MVAPFLVESIHSAFYPTLRRLRTSEIWSQSLYHPEDRYFFRAAVEAIPTTSVVAARTPPPVLVAAARSGLRLPKYLCRSPGSTFLGAPRPTQVLPLSNCQSLPRDLNFLRFPNTYTSSAFPLFRTPVIHPFHSTPWSSGVRLTQTLKHYIPSSTSPAGIAEQDIPSP